MLAVVIVIWTFNLNLCLSTAIDETTLELTLCKLLEHTPNYRMYHLDQHTECLSHVKSYGKIMCLRDGYNQVNFDNFKQQNVFFYAKKYKKL